MTETGILSRLGRRIIEGRPFWARSDAEQLTIHHFSQREKRPSKWVDGLTQNETRYCCPDCKSPIERPSAKEATRCGCGLIYRRQVVHDDDYCDMVWVWRDEPLPPRL